MYESFFGLINTPFERNLPVESLYSTPAYEELLSRLTYAAARRQFAVVTGDVGCGKSTTIRKFAASLDPNKYKIIYISDSSLTPRNFYWEALHQLGCEPRFYRGDAKRQMQKELMSLIDTHKKIPVIITDEAHLLSREMLEEIRFLLNYQMDSYNPLSLILVGQTELKDLLRLQIYEAITQRIDIRYHLPVLEKQETPKYIEKHLEYAKAAGAIFTDAALKVIHEYTGGVSRKINSLCRSSLMHAVGVQKKLIDDHMVRYVIENEFEW